MVPWTERPTTRDTLAGIGLIVAANAPLFVRAAAFARRGAGDARTHAMLARVLAESRVTHGWTDAYGGGFAVGPHYPVVGWGLSALLVRVGLSPMGAVDAVGFASVLAVPVLGFVLAYHSGARFGAALAGALFLSWVAPAGYFVGGYEAFYGQGLLSQVLVLPSVVVGAAAVARAKAPWKSTLPAVIAMACHPQVAIASVAVLAAPVVASRDRPVLARYARATLAMGFVAVALYGPGIATLHVPFGWPPMERWKTVGFGVDRLAPWLLGGALLDVNRIPVLTAAWAVAFLIAGAIALRGRPAPRGVAVASAFALVLSVSGGLLERLGAPGVFLLSFLQPLRVVSLLPIVAAATVVVSLEEAAPFARKLLRRVGAGLPPPLGRTAPAVAWTVAFALLALAAFPSRWAIATTIRDRVHAILDGFPDDAACGPAPEAGAPPRAVKSWVASLTGGRLWYDDTSAAGLECEFATGFELDASVPIGVTSGVGGHVGVHQVAFHQLAPERGGSAARAEALGVRHLLFFGRDPVGPGWEVVHRGGGAALARRLGGTDVVGVGCIRTVWTGTDAALRQRLLAAIVTRRGAATLLDPHELVALETAPGAWAESDAPGGDCSVEGAEVRELPREAGAAEAVVDAPSPVDVVVRVAAFPTWRVLVDGLDTPAVTVAPGYPSVRVQAGHHRVEATVAPLPGYALGVLLSLIAAALCSFPTLRFALPTKRRKLG